MAPHLSSIRRYPVKSMGGEYLDAVHLDARGVVGDRRFAVADEDGKFASGKNTRRFRRRDEVFEFAARTDAGTVVVTGPQGEFAVGDPLLDDALTARFGLLVSVREEAEVSHQDAGSVSLVGTATLEWCARRWGVDADPRRLRVNLVVDAEEPFVEETWVGHRIEVGACALDVVARVERCRTIQLDQDGVGGTSPWLKPLADEREMSLAVYADVVTPGKIAVGDAVSVR